MDNRQGYPEIYVKLCTQNTDGKMHTSGDATQRPGVQFPMGTVFKPSFTSFARDGKWGCCF